MKYHRKVCIVFFNLFFILLDSVGKVGKKYYPQILLKERKYAVKKKRNAISEELKLDECDDKSDDESDEENNVV